MPYSEVMSYYFLCARPGCGTVFETPYKDRKFCSIECSAGRSRTPTHDLIHDLGGVARVARRLRTSERSVRAWFDQGIAAWTLPLLASMARSKGLHQYDLTTLEEIAEAGRKTFRDRKTGKVVVDRRRKVVSPIEVTPSGQPSP